MPRPATPKSSAGGRVGLRKKEINFLFDSSLEIMLGFFDSGFGGLTILKEVLGVGAKEKSPLADYDFMYLGDSARAPYGNHSPEKIYRYTTEAVDFLFKQGCELVVLACFSASANALRKIQQEWLPAHYPGKKVLGVLIPTAEEAIKETKNNRVGILGTRATINSGALSAELLKRAPNLQIHTEAAPLLVPLIEEGWAKKVETKKFLRYYLRPLKNKKIDTLILACTHYPILMKDIQAIIGRRVNVFHPGRAESKSLADYLQRHPEIDSKLKKTGQRIFFATDRIEEFNRLGAKFLGEKIEAKLVSL